MNLVLFSGLSGMLLCILLTAPQRYYPLIILCLIGSIGIFIFSLKYFKIKKYFLILSPIILIISFYIISFTLFKENSPTPLSTNNISKSKQAVILYCDGEMEKYTPYYANKFMEDKSFILKPFYSFKIKQIYQKMGINKKNSQLVKIAGEVKTSLLNHGPYYFYIAFSGYTPDLNVALHQASLDGCGKIFIINFTSDLTLEEKVKSNPNFSSLQDCNMDIFVSKPVTSNKTFAEVFVNKIINIPSKKEALLLIDNGSYAGEHIKLSLSEYGYDEDKIFISSNVDDALKSIREKGYKSLLYVDLMDSGQGVRSEYSIPEKLNKLGNEIKISGIKGWGYSKDFVKSCIELFIELQTSLNAPTT